MMIADDSPSDALADCPDTLQPKAIDSERDMLDHQQALLHRKLLQITLISAITATVFSGIIVFFYQTGSVWFISSWYGACLVSSALMLRFRLINTHAVIQPTESPLGDQTSPVFHTALNITQRHAIALGCLWGLACLMFGRLDHNILLVLTLIIVSGLCGISLLGTPLPKHILSFAAPSLICLWPLCLLTGQVANILFVSAASVTAWALYRNAHVSYNYSLTARGIDMKARRAEHILYSSLEAASDPFVLMNEAGDIILENAAHQDHLFTDNLPASLQGNRLLETQDGKWFQQNWQTVPGIGKICLYRDITLQKAQEKLLMDTKRQAETAKSTQIRFLSRMSHELRGPLINVIGFADLLRASKHTKAMTKPEHIHEYADYIHTAGQHVLQLVEDMMDYADLGYTDTDIQLAPVALDAALKSAIELSRLKSGVNSEHRLTIKIHKDVRWVRTDSTLLGRILINILSNAMKFSETDSSITIRSKRTKSGYPSLVIRDHGMGMSETQIENAFTAFYQGDDSPERPYEGTGIGLSVAKRFADLLNIEIRIASKIADGTAVMLVFKAEKANPAVAQDVSRQASAA